ncbi:type ISP restriction/modification enzyme, partial [Fibrobacter sp.]|uniref:type ISP restriction/modification enzyme n=1 Tax=Fibrobacter sp. TaxID=35828 RepID=UPI00260C158B
PFKNIEWKELNPQNPQYFFVPKSEVGKEEYEKGFATNELFKMNSMGVTTGKDKILVNESIKKLQDNISSEYGCYGKEFVKKVLYRPFDKQYLYYDASKLARARETLAKNFEKDNYGLCLIRINSRDEGLTVFITDKITDKTLLSSKDNANVFPLYLYPTDGEEQLGETRKPNLDETIWRKIDACLDSSTPFPSASSGNYAQNDNSHITTPEQIFDYIYGVLHTPSYREKYKEFLKIDFPRIPYPENKEEFERIVSIGNKLRKLHLMEEIPPQATSFDIEGDNAVTELRFEKEKVYINKTQYFGNVPELAWNFYIGGYQPAQKWLKDRKNRTFTFDDISHYRKIIAILIETHKLMQNLDETAR